MGKKDAEINESKHEIQLSSLEMGCYTDLIAFPLGNFADTAFPLSSCYRRYVQFLWEIQQRCKTIRVGAFTLLKVAIISPKNLDGIFLSL